MIPMNKRRLWLSIVLVIITGGLWGIYWNYLLVKNIRALKQDDSGCVGEMLCLVFVPFYALYWWYTRGKYVKTEFEARGYAVRGSGILYLLLIPCGKICIARTVTQEPFRNLPETVPRLHLI